MNNYYYKKYLKYKTKYINMSVFAYDFDGVIHKLMSKTQPIDADHRGPDNELLRINKDDFSFLKIHLFKKTIEDIKRAQRRRIKVKIISANYNEYKKAIFDLLNSIDGIKINIDDIHMRVSPKDMKLRELKVSKFLDDSCYNIRTLHKAKKIGRLPQLKHLIWTIPEYEEFYDIDLNEELLLGKDKNWFDKAREGSLKGVQLIKN
uniref:Uncharacterized protein n=1 Tax=viral metagenome TaxID=1070528 RepID=A0A6C0J692_9ZZZZ